MNPERRSLLDELDLPPCPKCRCTKIIPVVFGLPSDELFERAGRGEVALGGCMQAPGVIGACKECRRWRTTRE